MMSIYSSYYQDPALLVKQVGTAPAAIAPTAKTYTTTQQPTTQPFAPAPKPSITQAVNSFAAPVVQANQPAAQSFASTGAGPDYARDDSKALAAGLRNQSKQQGQSMAFQPLVNRYDTMANYWASAKNPFNDGMIQGFVNNQRSQARGAADAAIMSANRNAAFNGQNNVSQARALAVQAQYGGQAANNIANAQMQLEQNRAGFEQARIGGMQGVEQARIAGATAMDQYNQFAPLNFAQGQANLTGTNIANAGNQLRLDFLPEQLRQGVESGRISLEQARQYLAVNPQILAQQIAQNANQIQSGNIRNMQDIYNFDEYQANRPNRDLANKLNTQNAVWNQVDQQSGGALSTNVFNNPVSQMGGQALGAYLGVGGMPGIRNLMGGGGGSTAPTMPGNNVTYHAQQEPPPWQQYNPSGWQVRLN